MRVLTKRMQRIDKAMSGEARQLFEAYVPDGDLAAFAMSLPRKVKNELVPTLGLLRDQGARSSPMMASGYYAVRMLHPAPSVGRTSVAGRSLGSEDLSICSWGRVRSFSRWIDQ